MDIRMSKVRSVKRNDKSDLLKAGIAALNLAALSYNVLPWKVSSFHVLDCFNWKYMVVITVLLFLLVKMMPFTKGYENLWVFVLGAFAFLPVNIKMGVFVAKFIMDINPFVIAIWSIVIAMALCSVEEIFLGTIARIIWRNQVEEKVVEEEEGLLQLCMEMYETEAKLRDFDSKFY